MKQEPLEIAVPVVGELAPDVQGITRAVLPYIQPPTISPAPTEHTEGSLSRGEETKTTGGEPSSKEERKKEVKKSGPGAGAPEEFKVAPSTPSPTSPRSDLVSPITQVQGYFRRPLTLQDLLERVGYGSSKEIALIKDLEYLIKKAGDGAKVKIKEAYYSNAVLVLSIEGDNSRQYVVYADGIVWPKLKVLAVVKNGEVIDADDSRAKADLIDLEESLLATMKEYMRKCGEDILRLYKEGSISRAYVKAVFRRAWKALDLAKDINKKVGRIYTDYIREWRYMLNDTELYVLWNYTGVSLKDCIIGGLRRILYCLGNLIGGFYRPGEHICLYFVLKEGGKAEQQGKSNKQ